jgi:hypothetical protein
VGLLAADYLGLIGFELAHGERKRWAEVISPENEGLEDVGTIAISDHKGTAFVDHYKIGRLIHPDEGMPPEEVLSVCNLTYQSVLEKSVFAPGEISVSYTEGSFPELMGIDAERRRMALPPGRSGQHQLRNPARGNLEPADLVHRGGSPQQCSAACLAGNQERVAFPVRRAEHVRELEVQRTWGR